MLHFQRSTLALPTPLQLHHRPLRDSRLHVVSMPSWFAQIPELWGRWSQPHKVLQPTWSNAQMSSVLCLFSLPRRILRLHLWPHRLFLPVFHYSGVLAGGPWWVKSLFCVDQTLIRCCGKLYRICELAIFIFLFFLISEWIYKFFCLL